MEKVNRKIVDYGSLVHYRREDNNMMVAGPNDTSPYHHTYPTGYDEHCSCCWLNIPHSEELHWQKGDGG